MGKVFMLTMLERFAILSALPKEGSYTTLRVLQELRPKLAPSEAEIKEMELKDLENGMTRMNDRAKEEREMEIGERAEDIINIALKQLNRAEKLQEHHLSIYAKFVSKEDI